jgi:GxxExxY protein
MDTTHNNKDRPLIFKDLTYRIIGAALEVYNTLGYGFIEDVYEKALHKEFDMRGIPAKSKCPIKVRYKGDSIPAYLPNILVDDKVIVELQADEKLSPKNEHNIINQLRATGLKVGLIINFGRDGCKPKRFIT